MTSSAINAAPDPAYEAWCEEQPTGVEWNGDYVEIITASGRAPNIFGHQVAIYGSHTRYRGEFDLAAYGECLVDRDFDFSGPGFYAAHFMAH